MNKKKKNQKTWQSGTERKTGKIGEQALPPLPPPKNNQTTTKNPPQIPQKLETKKKIFKSSLASQKAINFKDYIGTFYIKSALITVSIKNKP